MLSRLETLPRELVSILFSYLDHVDVEHIHNIGRLRRLFPDLLDKKARETYSSITVTNCELPFRNEPGNGATHPSPYHAMEALWRNHKAADYVAALDLSEGLYPWARKHHPSKSSRRSMIVRRWVCRFAFSRNVLRVSTSVLQNQAFVEAFYERATPFRHGPWWSRRQKHTDFTDALLLMVALPNLEALGIEADHEYTMELAKFWCKVYRAAQEHDLGFDQINVPLSQLKTLKLAEKDYLGPRSLSWPFTFAEYLKGLRVLVFEGIIEPMEPPQTFINSIESVERIEFHYNWMSPALSLALFETLPNVREVVFERCPGRPSYQNPRVMEPLLAEDVFKSLLVRASPIMERLEKLRVGLDSPEAESFYSFEQCGPRFLRFTNLRVLDVSAALLCPPREDAMLSALNDSLPRTLEVLRLQSVPTLPAAQQLFKDFRATEALPNLKLVALSGPMKILRYVRSVCEKVHTRVEFVKTGGEWAPFGTAKAWMI